MFQIGLKKLLWLKKLKALAYFISDLKSEEIVRMFDDEELLKTNWKEFKVEKVIKRKGNALHVKWKAFDSSFTSWIDK